ncbi:MAG TPA: hypothetical protein VI750_06105, partial [Pyrinomonadaceae bacterium]|nr:hypothetical protein [Pyrinomonadaceae bacterium]
MSPVLDPLSLTPLRNAAIHSAWARGKIDLPRGIRKKLGDTRVLTSAELAAPRFRRDFARTRNVEAAPDRVRNQKLKFRDERKEERGQSADRTGGEVRQRDLDSARQQRHLLEQQRSADGSKQWSSQRRLERNDRAKRARDLDLARGQQMRLLEQQRRETQIELRRSRQSASQQAQGERVGRPERKQKP